VIRHCGRLSAWNGSEPRGIYTSYNALPPRSYLHIYPNYKYNSYYVAMFSKLKARLGERDSEYTSPIDPCKEVNSGAVDDISVHSHKSILRLRGGGCCGGRSVSSNIHTCSSERGVRERGADVSQQSRSVHPSVTLPTVIRVKADTLQQL
jgi:hypothetical protein